MTNPGVVVETVGAVVRLVLSRPERRNALDRAAVEAIETACQSVGSARVVVISGEGSSFCAGADVAELRTPNEHAERIADTLRLRRMLCAVRHCRVPVVAAVQGHALGAGCALAACADVVVASPDATFGLPEVRLGVPPAVVMEFVAERVGRGTLGRMALLGAALTADEARLCGLVDVVAPSLDVEVDRVVALVFQAAPGAVAATKSILGSDPGPIRQAKLMAELRDGPEAAEGLAALAQHRRASWTRIAADEPHDPRSIK